MFLKRYIISLATYKKLDFPGSIFTRSNQAFIRPFLRIDKFYR